MIHGLDTSFLVQAEVSAHADHRAARSLLERLLKQGDTFALAPQVLAEFIHVVTDARRFTRPLDKDVAEDRAERWWRAEEVIHAYPRENTVPTFLSWLREHSLGRKRLLDTLLAATYLSNDIESIVSTNARDFHIFGRLKVLEP